MEQLPVPFQTTFFEHAEGYFAVFNLTNRKTFTRIRELVSRYRKAVPLLEARKVAMLIGTHEDVHRNRRQVSDEAFLSLESYVFRCQEAYRLANELDCVYQDMRFLFRGFKSLGSVEQVAQRGPRSAPELARHPFGDAPRAFVSVVLVVCFNVF